MVSTPRAKPCAPAGRRNSRNCARFSTPPESRGLSFEYWSPAPFWKANQSYTALEGKDGRARNRLRPFAPDFANDPVYKGDADRFFADFSEAVVTDIRTLAAAGIKTSMFGLQNEPYVNHSIYSTCEYPDSTTYIRAYRAVAEARPQARPEDHALRRHLSRVPQAHRPGHERPGRRFSR